MTQISTDFDFFVIGGGSGGVRAARIAAGYGARVGLAEEFRFGGTCVIRGCVPKKIYVYASRFADEMTEAAGFGWHVEGRSFDWPHLVAAKEREITRLSGLYRGNLEKAGVTLFEARATIAGPHDVMLGDGRRVTARHILVATGGHPDRRPVVPGIELAVTSNEVFDLPVLPKAMLVVGAGYVAVEFASIFARLGVAVTLVFRGEQVLRGFDQDMREGLAAQLAAAGIAIRAETNLTAIARVGDRLDARLTDGTSLVVDQVLIATGRQPATAGLGLESAGVALDGAGAIVVDGFSRSSVPSIHAVGDVTNRVNLTPVAIREGHALADTLFGDKPTSVSHDAIATAVFTTPEIGTVGLTEAEARAAYDIVDIYRTAFRPMKATISGHEGRVIMKIVVDGQSDRVLGVHILGEAAGEMAQLLGIAVRMRATKADFDDTMAVHPTAAEELVTLRTRTARHLREGAR